MRRAQPLPGSAQMLNAERFPWTTGPGPAPALTHLHRLDYNSYSNSNCQAAGHLRCAQGWRRKETIRTPAGSPRHTRRYLNCAEESSRNFSSAFDYSQQALAAIELNGFEETFSRVSPSGVRLRLGSRYSDGHDVPGQGLAGGQQQQPGRHGVCRG